MTQSLWINGKQQSKLDVRDRGFAYGDGVFETIQVLHGRAQLLDRHVRRMKNGAQRLGFLSSSVGQLLTDLHSIELPDEAVLKLTLSRGVGGRGYTYDSNGTCTRVIMLAPKPTYGDRAESGIRLRVCDTRLGLNPALAGIKHLNRLEQVLARNEWSDPAIHEGVVLDYEGYIAEGTMSNLFWVKDQCIYTPRLDRCGVAGVVRDFLVERFSQAGADLKVGLYELPSLRDADEVFICNSLIDIWPVRQLEDVSYQSGPVAQRARQYLVEEYQA
ncbi:MAG: aminodeoxychorismate lyase [Oceanospirillaceae bacterium]|nr:aminodeoxychorismate lyase [Oceanospirillaceae bacterium]